MHFQDVILALHRFWGEQGCALEQPFDLEVGAGTFHPATFFGALGPSPWKVAYVQPSRRPRDGRYGDNPMRMAFYYQYLQGEPRFDCHRTLDALRNTGIECPGVTVEFIHRMVGWYVNFLNNARQGAASSSPGPGAAQPV